MESLGKNPNLLFVGQKILVPCRNATPVVEVAEPANEPVASQPYTDQSAQFDLVTSGQVDATYVYNGYLADSHPLLQLPMIPLMGGSAEQTAVSLWNLHEKYLSTSNYFNEAQLLGFISAPAAHIWRDLDTPVMAGEDILQKNAYPVPYFDGLDTIGPRQVQAQNKEKYASGFDADGNALAFLMAHGAARGGARPKKGAPVPNRLQHGNASFGIVTIDGLPTVAPRFAPQLFAFTVLDRHATFPQISMVLPVLFKVRGKLPVKRCFDVSKRRITR